MNNKFWELVGYIKRSPNRTQALELLINFTMPSELGKKIGISLTHASKIIRELNSKNMISCLNKNLKVGRIYVITFKGKEILQQTNSSK